MDLEERIKAKQKGSKIVDIENIEAVENKEITSLEDITESDIIDLVETETIENIIDDEIEKVKEQEAIQEIQKENDEDEESLNNRTNDDIYEMLVKIRESNLTLNETISNKRTDALNYANTLLEYFKYIKGSLSYIKRHINKWFVYVLVLCSFVSFILGGVANENKESVYPIVDKAVSVWNSIGNSKKVMGD